MPVLGPLDGYPLTTQSVDDHGFPAYVIEPRELTPEGAKWRANTERGLLACAVAFTIYEWYNHDWSWFALIFMGLLSLIGYRVLMRIVDKRLRQKTRIVLTREFVSVRRSGEDWMHLSYANVSGFVMRQHDKAREEQLQLEYEAQAASLKQRVLRKHLFYGEAFHLAAIYLGQHVDLLTSFGPSEARAVMERLQLCYRLLYSWSGATTPEQSS